MTLLPTVIHKAGFELTMIKRVGRVSIYRQHLPGGNPDHDAYEVIVAQVRNTNHRGQPVDPYEGYPAAESWGKEGWTFTDRPKAVQKLTQLAQKASCAGTVSRKNRSDGHRILPTSNKVTRTHYKPCSSRIGQGRPVKGQAGQGVPVKHKVSEPGPVLEVSCELAGRCKRQ